MASSGAHMERLHNLEKIEHDITTALELAGQAVGEYAKDRPTNRTAENHAQTFLKTVSGIETNLLKQISYLSQVSTTHPHTGSSYGAQKDWQMSMQRVSHVAGRLEELSKLQTDTSQPASHQSELRKALSHQSSFPPTSGTSSSNN